LDRIQHVLADALRAAEARANALEPAHPDETGITSNLSEVDILLARPLSSANPCEQQVAETEQVLATAQEALDRWLATAARVAQRLAEQAARAV
jgi:hypothetical protein